MSDLKRKRWSLIGTILIQISLFLLFYFLIAWKEPIPPNPSFGIEIGFVAPATAKKATSPVRPEQEEPEVSDELVVENESEALTEEEVSELPSVEETEIFEDESSPDPLEKTTEAIPQAETKDSQKDKPEVNPSQPTDLDQEMIEGEEIGEEEVEEQVIDSRSLYGTQSESKGASLQLSGWNWDQRPNPNDPSDESGTVEYEIKVDSDGYLVSIALVRSTLSPSVERYYRESIEKLTFSKTNDYKPAPTSTGRVTFIVQAK